jgi:hypothetical protein
VTVLFKYSQLTGIQWRDPYVYTVPTAYTMRDAIQWKLWTLIKKLKKMQINGKISNIHGLEEN